MAKKDTDRFASLAADLRSPKVIVAIDKALADLRQEWLDLLDLRTLAVRRHGDNSPAPSLPEMTEQAILPDVIAKPFTRSSSSGMTWAALVDHYRSDQRSPYHYVRHATRGHYDMLIKRILDGHADVKLADLEGHDLEQMHKDWAKSGKLASSYALIGMVRMLVNFGASILKDSECERLAVPLHRMRTTVPNPRTERLITQEDVLSLDQAKAIIEKAHTLNLPSLALAQAIQFECKLRQRDVIGEWVPLSDPGHENSPLIDSGQRWIRGLRWEQIDENMILRHTSIRGRNNEASLGFEFDLSAAPLVQAEFARQGRQESGPMIVYEVNDLPYRAHQFRRKWREIADAVGIPKHIKNMDKRARGPDENDEEQSPGWAD